MNNARGISITMRPLTILLVLTLAAGAMLLGTSLPAAMADNPPAPVPRLAIPDAAAQAKTEKLIRDIFGNYAAAPLAERPALAAKLIDQAMASADDPVGRFVLLKDGADLAASGGDAVTAMRGATLLASVYAVDEGELKLALLRRAANAATGPSYAGAVASESLNCANEAVAAGNYDLASRLILTSEQAAHTAKNLPLMLSVQSRAADIKWLEHESARAKAAEDKLNKSPADSDANHTLGRYFCLVRGDWAHGLVGLSKGSNPAYHAAATADLANPATSEKQVAAGDLWWDLAEKETAGAAQKALRRRAGYWYAQAAANPQLTGLRRALVEKKLSQVRPPAPGEAVAEVPPAVPAPAVSPPEPAPAPRPSGNIFPDAPAAVGGATIQPSLPHALLVLCFEENDFYRVGSGTFIRDLSGHDNKVEVHGATICDGRAGKGLHFDGKSWVDISGSYPEGAKPRTIVAWARIDDGQEKGVLLNYGVNHPGRHFGCLFNVKDGWRLFDAQGGPMAGLKADTQWHHHAIIYTGTELQYYVDGKLAASKPAIEDTASQPMVLGVRTDRGGGGFFAGTIDEVAVFDTALSAADVQAVYDRGTLGQPLVLSRRGSAVPRHEAGPSNAQPNPAPTPASNPPVGPDPAARAKLTADQWAIASGLFFSDFSIPIDREWTYTKGRILVDNRSPVGQVENKVRARIRILCINADKKPRVLEYYNDVKIAAKGRHEVFFSGMGNDEVKFNNAGDWKPHNAHILIEFDGVEICQVLWKPAGETGGWRGEMPAEKPGSRVEPEAPSHPPAPGPSPAPAAPGAIPPRDSSSLEKLTKEQREIARGLEFSNVFAGGNEGHTYGGASIHLNNRSPVGQITEPVRSRTRLLCMNADGKPVVLELWHDVKIGQKGDQILYLGGIENSEIKFNNGNRTTPENAHVIIFFAGVPIYQGVWKTDDKSRWWEDELLVRKK